GARSYRPRGPRRQGGARGRGEVPAGLRLPRHRLTRLERLRPRARAALAAGARGHGDGGDLRLGSAAGPATLRAGRFRPAPREARRARADRIGTRRGGAPMLNVLKLAPPTGSKLLNAQTLP